MKPVLAVRRSLGLWSLAIALAACGRTGLLVPQLPPTHLDASGLFDSAHDADSDARVGADGSPGPCTVSSASTLPAPRPLAPISTGFATTRHPTLRWQLTDPATGACVEVCRDRGCASIVRSYVVDGDRLALDMDLPAGVTFWRTRGRRGDETGAAMSPTWEFSVGARSTPVDSSWGSRLDVNGDGYGDLLVAAPSFAGLSGRVYVFLGSRDGVSTVALWVLDAPDGPQSAFGQSLSSAGDVDGDGFGDVVVGAPQVDANAGRAYVYRGGSDRMVLAATLPTPANDGEFGLAVSGLGDVNADGYADLAVGAKRDQTTVSHAYVYLGRATPLGPAADQMLTGSGDPFEFFFAATTAGDINGDGFDDVVIPAGNFNPESGRVYVYMGGASGVERAAVIQPVGSLRGYFGRGGCAGDVNGDGYTDLLAGASGTSLYSGYVDVYLGGPRGIADAPSITLGDTGHPSDFLVGEASTVGDVNGDGYDDFGVGTYVGENNQTHIRVFYGSPSGPSATRLTQIDGPMPAMASFGDTFGEPRDFDRDGVADFAAGAWSTFASPGFVWVFRGAAAGITSTPTQSIANPSGNADAFGEHVALRSVRSRGVHRRTRL